LSFGLCLETPDNDNRDAVIATDDLTGAHGPEIAGLLVPEMFDADSYTRIR
jgi:hypothetical protein